MTAPNNPKLPPPPSVILFFLVLSSFLLMEAFLLLEIIVDEITLAAAAIPSPRSVIFVYRPSRILLTNPSLLCISIGISMCNEVLKPFNLLRKSWSIANNSPQQCKVSVVIGCKSHTWPALAALNKTIFLSFLVPAFVVFVSAIEGVTSGLYRGTNLVESNSVFNLLFASESRRKSGLHASYRVS